MCTICTRRRNNESQSHHFDFDDIDLNILCVLPHPSFSQFTSYRHTDIIQTHTYARASYIVCFTGSLYTDSLLYDYANVDIIEIYNITYGRMDILWSLPSGKRCDGERCTAICALAKRTRAAADDARPPSTCPYCRTLSEINRNV